MPSDSNRVCAAVLFAAGVTALIGCWFVGTATAQPGGVPSETAAERQLVQVLRGEHARASYRRCHDEITRYAWPVVRRIPADKVRAVRRTWENRLAAVIASARPRAVCWRSHHWAESSAGRCVSSKEGGIRSNTGNGYVDPHEVVYRIRFELVETTP